MREKEEGKEHVYITRVCMWWHASVISQGLRTLAVR